MREVTTVHGTGYVPLVMSQPWPEYRNLDREESFSGDIYVGYIVTAKDPLELSKGASLGRD